MGRFKDLELKIAAGVATEADFAEFAAADVARIKTQLPYVARGRLHQAEVEAALAPLLDGPAAKAAAPSLEEAARAARTKTLIFNVQLPDRMGDIVIANPSDAKKYGGAGYQTQHWMAAGGPYLWCHDPYDGGAVGRVTSPRAEKVKATLADGSVAKAWGFVGDVEFLADENLEHALESWAMVQAGFTASSIGFIPRVSVYIDDQEERTKLGLGPWGVLYPEIEILEVSHVLIPANPWSVELDRANGKTIEAAVRKMQGQGLLTASRADRLAALVAKRAHAQVVVPDLSKALAPKLKSAQAHADRPCEGLECMVASGGDDAGTVARWDREEHRHITGRGGVSPAGVLLLGSGDQHETLIPTPKDFKIPTAVLSLAGVPDAPSMVITLDVHTLDPVEFAQRLSQNAEAVGSVIRGALSGKPKAAAHDCGCGAKTLEAQLADAKTARATAEARVRELEALPEIRNTMAVRRAFDLHCEAGEHLAIALNGDAEENVEDALEPSESGGSFLVDLQAVRADTTLLGVLEPLVRVLAAKARSGAPRVAAAPAAPSPRVVSDSALAADLSAALADVQSARGALGARSAT